MTALAKKWVWAMAFRDARRGLKTLLLSMSCIVFGVAAVVASFSFHDNLRSSIRVQAKSLLGADLALESREPFSQEAEALMASLGGEQTRQVGVSSMAYFPATGSSRLVQVRAIGENFPYYGVLETDPTSAVQMLHSGRHALVDENLMLQFSARVGDRLKIGEQEFRIAGKLRRIPGETLAFSLLSPRVYVPYGYLEQTQLIAKGSLVRYRVYFKFPPAVDVDQLVKQISPELERLRLQPDTVTRRMNSISASIENLSRYLHLALFIAVLLAGIGVASGIHVYAKEKTPAVAALRCIGATPKETVAVYLIQCAIVGLAGSLLGAILGASLQVLLPMALKDFLPVHTVRALSVPGILVGCLLGLGTAVLFGLIPLVSLRSVSPLLALRSSLEMTRSTTDPVRAVIIFVIAAAVIAFAYLTTARWDHALWFAAGIAVAFGSLAGIARVIAAILQKVAPEVLPFSWRAGLANLHRPNNQTAAVMIAVGLGTFLLSTLYIVQSMLVNQVVAQGGKDVPNLVLFDVQKEQRPEITRLLQSFGIRAYEEVPIVTLRLTGVKDKSVEELRSDGSIPPWALRREYRSTYRRRLTDAEQLVAGKWEARADPDTPVVPVSLEKGIAQTLKVTLGDHLQFDLQGVSLVARVTSIREVDWQRVQPNFFMVFPEGVLEHAPQFYALAVRTESTSQSAAIQRGMVERFPSVSMIDLGLVLNTLDAILSRVSSAIRFVAFFTLLTGLAVLGSAILSSRSQRLKESILMRTLGAVRSQIIAAIAAEYVFLAAISSVTGLILSMIAGWALSYYFLGVVATISWMPVVTIVFLMIAATVIAGVLGCWGIFKRPALELLRAET